MPSCGNTMEFVCASSCIQIAVHLFVVRTRTRPLGSPFQTNAFQNGMWDALCHLESGRHIDNVTHSKTRRRSSNCLAALDGMAHPPVRLDTICITAILNSKRSSQMIAQRTGSSRATPRVFDTTAPQWRYGAPRCRSRRAGWAMLAVLIITTRRLASLCGSTI